MKILIIQITIIMFYNLAIGQELNVITVDKRINLESVTYREHPISNGFYFFSTRAASDKYCYFGIKNNEEIIFPEMFSNFENLNYDSLIIVEREDEKGLFSLKDKKWILPVEFKAIERSPDGYYKVRKKRKYGVYDSSFNLLLTFKYKSIQRVLGSKLCIVLENNGTGEKYGLYDLGKAKFVFPCKYDFIGQATGKRAFIIKEKEKANIVRINKDILYLEDWYDNIINKGDVSIVMKDGRFAIMNIDYELVTPFDFIKIDYNKLKGGSFIAVNENQKYGCVNSKGEVTIPFEYDKITNERYSPFIVTKKENKFGVLYIDSGKIKNVANCEYDSITTKLNICLVKNKNKSLMLLSTKRQLLYLDYDGFKFISIANSISLIIIVQNKNKYYLINRNGKKITDKGFLLLKGLNSAKEERTQYDYLIFQDASNKFGLINGNGKIVIEPQFDEIIDKVGQVIKVKSNNKLGLYHIKEKIYLVPCEYERIDFNRNDNYFAKKENKFYRIVIEEYDENNSVKIERLL